MPPRTSPILPQHATPVSGERLPALLEAVRGWGRVRVVVRSRLAVMELVCDLGGPGATLDAAGGVLTVATAEAEAHLPLLEAAGAASACFVVRPGHGHGLSRSVAWLDAGDEVLCQVYLLKTRADADYPPEQIEAFERARRDLGARSVPAGRGG